MLHELAIIYQQDHHVLTQSTVFITVFIIMDSALAVHNLCVPTSCHFLFSLLLQAAVQVPALAQLCSWQTHHSPTGPSAIHATAN
jgi:hypothetical protein